MILKKTIKLFGVAGSGKTTECMNHIKEFLDEGYNTFDICFTTFTRAGIRSIKEKLLQNDIDIKYSKSNFRTLNSLTWKLAGFDVTQEMNESDKRDFFDSIKINTENEEDNKKSEMDIILEIYTEILNIEGKFMENLDELIIKKHIFDYMERTDDIDLSYEKIDNSLKLFNKWKKEKNKYVYIDSIIYVLEHQIDIPNKILIVDEAQDLSPAQYKLIDLWTKTFDRDIFIISGDDDQTVHEWAGASPKYLLEYDSENMKKEILEHSYRLPKNISLLCNDILKNIKTREIKFIKSNKIDGDIVFINSNENELIVDLEREYKSSKDFECYLLFRTNKSKRYFEKILFNVTNIPFGCLSREKSLWTDRFCFISNALNKIEKGYDLTKSEALKLFESLPSNSCLKRGTKTTLKSSQKQEYQTKELLEMTKRWSSQRIIIDFNKNDVSKKGIKEDMIKFIDYNKSSDEKEKIEKNDMYRRKFNEIREIFEPKIETNDFGKEEIYFDFNVKLGTFHSSKGLECDNVYVFMGTSQYFEEINDSERRCFYVACSRAKKNLYFVGRLTLSDNSSSALEDEYENLIRDYET